MLALLRESGWHAEDRRHWPFDEEAHGDNGRGNHGRRDRLHRAAAQGRQAFLLLVEFDQDAHLDTSEGRSQRQRLDWEFIPMAWSSTTAKSDSFSPSSTSLGIADNTIVMYSTDNGAEELSWPDGGSHAVPRREGYQLGWRLARAVRDPLAGRHQARHGIQRRLLAPGHASHVAGSRRRAGHRRESARRAKAPATRPSRSTSTASILYPYLKGEVKENPRPGFLYWSDEGDLMALRYGNWKIHFNEQRSHGFDAWQDPLTPLRLPKLVNLRTDPFEEADLSSMFYQKWRADRVFVLAPRRRPRRPVHEDAHGVPAASEPGELESRRGDGKTPSPPGGSGIRFGRRS